MALSRSSSCFDGTDRCSEITVKGGAPLVFTIIEIDEAGVIIIVVLSRPIIAISTRADRIIVMKDGKLEAFDTPERLLETSPTYKKMVYLQELEREVESYSSKKGGGRRE